MVKNLFGKPKQFKEIPLNKSAGILDDFAVRKDIATREGTIEKTPVNDNDIVNKKYVDDNAGGFPSSPSKGDLVYYHDGSITNTGIDYMEYASNATARTAYVSSDATITYGANIVPTMTSNTAPAGYETSASSSYDVYLAWKAFDKNINDYGWISAIGGIPAWLKLDYGSGNEKIVTKYSVRGTKTYTTRSPKDWTFEGSNNDSDWDVLDTITGETGWGSVENRVFICDTYGSYRYYRLNISDNNGDGSFISLCEIEMFENSSDGNLQVYSESTIKTQGDYSLKGIGLITDSLNDTLTNTLSSNIDLTDIDTLKLDIRSSRTGSNIKIGIHDSGGTTTELTPSISSADTFETKTWDISGVSNANKNDIDSIIITITNAGAENTFYIDNFYGVAPTIEAGWKKLAIGTTGQTLKVVSGLPAWSS